MPSLKQTLLTLPLLVLSVAAQSSSAQASSARSSGAQSSAAVASTVVQTSAAAGASATYSNNAFAVPTGGYTGVTAGRQLTLTWMPTSTGTVTLVLRSGASGNLNQGTLIVAGAQNSGSYVWNVPSTITRGSDYTVEIIADNNPSIVNFSPTFSIDSTNTVASSTGIVTVSAALAASSAASSVISTHAMTTGASSMATSTRASSAATGNTSAGAAQTGTTTSAAPTGTHTNAAGAVKGGAMGALAFAAGLAALM